MAFTAIKQKSKALAIKRPGDYRRQGERRPMPSPGKTDLRRWFLFDTMQMTEQAIADKEKTSVLNVHDSIEYIKEWKFRNSTAMLDTKFIEVVMSQMDDVGRVYQRGMKAEKVVHVNQKTGKVKKMPDIAMQLKTAAEIRSAVETVHPKGPALQFNQQNNIGVGGGGYGPGASFEAILRKKREEKGLLNSQEAEIIEGELTHAEQIQDEFKDFGGSDDDGDDGDDDEGDDE